MPAPDRLQSPPNWIELLRLLLLGRSRLQHTTTQEPPAQDSEALVQLHIAEYAALTTRITYWIPIQYSLGGAICLTLLNFVQADAKHQHSGSFVWATVVAVEIFFGAFYYTLFEIMADSDYIENKLARKIEGTLPDTEKKFWGYQRYRKENRVYSPYGMYIPMIFCIAIPLIALSFFRPLCQSGPVDYVGAIISAGIVLWDFRIARAAVSTQRRFAE